MGILSLRAAECCGVENGDVARSRRADTDARCEYSAQYVRRYVESNRVLVDGAATWVLQGGGQEQRDRTAGVKALFSMLASTTSGRAKELVKQSLSDRNGMVAFGRARERFGKTAGVVKLTDVFQFSSNGLPRIVWKTSG